MCELFRRQVRLSQEKPVPGWWDSSHSFLGRSVLHRHLCGPGRATGRDFQPGQALVPSEASTAKASTARSVSVEPTGRSESSDFHLGFFQRGQECPLLTEQPLSAHLLLSLVNTFFSFCVEKPEQNIGVNFVAVSPQSQRPARLLRSQRGSSDRDFSCVFASIHVYCLCIFTYKIILP